MRRLIRDEHLALPALEGYFDALVGQGDVAIIALALLVGLGTGDEHAGVLAVMRQVADRERDDFGGAAEGVVGERDQGSAVQVVDDDT